MKVGKTERRISSFSDNYKQGCKVQTFKSSLGIGDKDKSFKDVFLKSDVIHSNFTELRLCNVVYYTTADGPGVRHSIYTQGCLHKCEGCHNPQTHDTQAGKLYAIDKIVAELSKHVGVTGITLSGGDPLYQYNALLELLKEIKINPILCGLDIMIYTGYTWEEILDKFKGILEYTNSVMTERFVKSKFDKDLLFRGSSNQVWVDVTHYLSTGEIREPN